MTERENRLRAGVEYVDSWGCIWKTDQDGITGSVIFHPLAEWDALESYRVPDPRKHNGWGEVSWEKVSRQLDRQRQNEQLVRHDLRHGFFFLTLEYSRGYENLMYDMANESGHGRLSGGSGRPTGTADLTAAVSALSAPDLSTLDETGSPEGGLALFYELYPGAHVENIRTVMDAM